MSKNAFYNHDAEAAVIAALASDKRDTAKYAAQLSAEDFHKPEHKTLFQAIQAVSAARKGIATIAIADTLTKLTGSDALISELMNIRNAHALEGWAIEDNIAVVKAASLRRALYLRLDSACEQLKNPSNDVSAVLDSTRQGLRDMCTTTNNWKNMQDVLLNAYETLEERASGKKKVMPSGIPSLDKIISGFHRGELTIIGARPAVGKSALGMFIALATAKQGYRVGVVSREMTDVQYGLRVLGSTVDTENVNLRTGKLDPCDWAQLSESLEYHGVLPISFLFTVRDIEDLRMEVQNRADTQGLDMLIVDYLQLMQSKQSFEKDYLRVGYVSKALKDMTTDFNIPIIALAQVGRAAQKGLPTLSDLRGSGDLEQDADNVIFIHRPEDSSDDSLLPGDENMPETLASNGLQYIVLNVAKQRQGEIGRTAVIFDPAHMRYTGIAK